MTSGSGAPAGRIIAWWLKSELFQTRCAVRLPRLHGGAESFCRVKAAQRLQGGDRLRGGGLALDPGRDADVSIPGNSKLGNSTSDRADRDRLPDRAGDCLGFRSDTGRNQADGSCGCKAATFAKPCLDLRSGYRTRAFARLVLPRPVCCEPPTERNCRAREQEHRGVAV